MDAYEKAGFLPEQAFALLLQDIANDMTLARGMSEAARTTKANLQS